MPKTAVFWIFSGLILFGSASAATEAEMQAAKTQGQTLGVAKASSNPTAAASGTFNSTSGVGGYSSMGEPGNGGTAGAKGSNTYSMTVDCNVTRTKYVGGIGVRYGTCSLDANANVTAIPFSVCTASQSGAICGTGDWSGYQTVNKGGNQTFAGGKVVIKVASCSYNTCQVALTDNDQASGTGASLNTQGQQSVEAEGSGGLAGQQNSVYAGSLYHGALRGAGSQVNCYNTNVSQALEDEGKVYTCDGQQSATLDPGCKTVTECLQQSTTTKTWTETCEAEVPLTTKTCSTKIPTVDCEEEMIKQDFTCSNDRIVTVTGKAGCTPGQKVVTVTANPCGGCPDYLVYDFTCNTDMTSYTMHAYSVLKWQAALPQNMWYTLGTTNVPGYPGAQIPKTQGPTKMSGGSCYRTYYAQACNDSTCTTTTWFENPCQGTSHSGSNAFPLPYLLSYQDGWDDKCSSYK